MYFLPVENTTTMEDTDHSHYNSADCLLTHPSYSSIQNSTNTDRMHMHINDDVLDSDTDHELQPMYHQNANDHELQPMHRQKFNDISSDEQHMGLSKGSILPEECISSGVVQQFDKLSLTHQTTADSNADAQGLNNNYSDMQIDPNQIAILTRCFYIHNYQWTQSTWGLLNGTHRRTLNYSFKDYPHNSYKIIINNYNYSTIKAKDQKSFQQGLHLFEEFLLRHDIKVLYAHKTIINELLAYLPGSLHAKIIFRPTCNLSHGVYISSYCMNSRNHNSINCSLCIYEIIRLDILTHRNLAYS